MEVQVVPDTAVPASNPSTARRRGHHEVADPLPAKAHFWGRALDVASVWDDFDRDPSFFSEVRIARDGGFSEVPSLLEIDRFFFGALSVCFILMNAYFLAVPNIQLLANERWLLDYDQEVSASRSHRLIVTNAPVRLVSGKEFHPQVLLALLELSLFVVMLVQVFCLVLNVFGVGSRTVSSKAAHRWHAVAVLFWDMLPHLMTFSGVHLLNHVTPSIFIPALTIKVKSVVHHRSRRHWLHLARFLLIRFVSACIGFDAFVVKFVETSRVVTEEPEVGFAMLSSLAFLNQMLGVVQVSRFVQMRLFVFIFGGEDGFISDHEEVRRRCWLAMLSRRIWHETGARQFRVIWFLAIMLSYSDQDFQKLVLNEVAKSAQCFQVSGATAAKQGG